MRRWVRRLLLRRGICRLLLALPVRLLTLLVGLLARLVRLLARLVRLLRRRMSLLARRVRRSPLLVGRLCLWVLRLSRRGELLPRCGVLLLTGGRIWRCLPGAVFRGRTGHRNRCSTPTPGYRRRWWIGLLLPAVGGSVLPRLSHR
ncbi:hypothetical protein GCM10027290_66530 [Micromonospora sonneratiae]